MRWSAETPYNDLPGLPPVVDLESRAVLRATVSARAALAGVHQAAYLLPNAQILLNAVSILEAQASSEIENIVTTADELFRQSDEKGAITPETQEALRYQSALFEGVEALRLRPLTFGTAESVCSRIKNRQMTVRKVPGTRIANPSTKEIIYSPPEGAAVISAMLSNWEKYLHAEDGLDPLIRMAVSHYQFEAIHPFHDGNGRTGRIINVLVLVEAGLIDAPILYLSRYIIKRKNDYYRLLREVTSRAQWEPWILYMLDAVEKTADSTVKKIHAIRSLQEHFRVRAVAATNGGRNADFLSVLFEQPYTRIKVVSQRCEVSRQTAASWLNELEDVGILRSMKVGRDKLFLNHELLEVLLAGDFD